MAAESISSLFTHLPRLTTKLSKYCLLLVFTDGLVSEVGFGSSGTGSGVEAASVTASNVGSSIVNCSGTISMSSTSSVIGGSSGLISANFGAKFGKNKFN